MARHGKWLDHLDADEKRIISECGRSSLKEHGLVAVSESGLYKLIVRSDRLEAQPFPDWVTQEVLPAIRKDGACIQGGEGSQRRAE